MLKKQWMCLMTGWIVGMCVGTLRAEDVKPGRPWADSLEASVVSANGNSKTTTTSAKNTFSYTRDRSTLELIGGGFGGSDKDGPTDELYFASEKVSYALTGKNYAYEKIGWDKDRFSGIRNRVSGSTGLGRALLSLPEDKLTGELGGGYINENRIGEPVKNFIVGRAYIKYEHAFSATVRFTQETEYLHDFMDAADYRVNTESAFVTALAGPWSLRTSFVWHRINRPVLGDVKDDTRLMAGLVINY